MGEHKPIEIAIGWGLVLTALATIYYVTVGNALYVN